jgi:hypothetical protein
MLKGAEHYVVIISNKPLKIQAEFTLAEEGGDYSNIMNFSTGVLHFQRNYKEGNDNINAILQEDLP